jgi:hypothetical protein
MQLFQSHMQIDFLDDICKDIMYHAFLSDHYHGDIVIDGYPTDGKSTHITRKPYY